MFQGRQKHHRLINEPAHELSENIQLPATSHTVRREPVPSKDSALLETVHKIELYDGEARPKHDMQDNTSQTYEVVLWSPFYLRRCIIWSFSATFAMIFVLIIILQQESRRLNGLVKVASKDYYLWTYGPTTVFTLISALWGQVEYRTLQLLPWRLMSYGYVSASDSVLLDYVSMWNVLALLKSLRRRHFMVSIAVMVSLIIKIITAFSTGLFTATHAMNDYRTSFKVNEFSDIGFDQTKVDARAYMKSWGVHDQNLKDPVGTSGQYAFQTFYQDTINEDGPPAYLPQHWYTANVDVFAPGLECSDATVATSSNDSAVGVHHSECSLQRPWSSTFMEGLYVELATCNGTSSELGQSDLKLWVYIAEETDKDRGQPLATNWLGGEGENATIVEIMYFDFVALMCTPRYNTYRANITLTGETDISHPSAAVDLGEATTVPGLSNFTASSLLYAVYSSVTQADPIGPEYVLLDIDFPALSSIFDSAKLTERVTDSFQAISVQVANDYLTRTSIHHVEGTVMVAETRLVLRDVSAIIISSLLGILFVLSVLFGIFYLPSAVSPRDPGSVAGLAAILARSTRFLEALSGTGTSTAEELERLLSNQRYMTALNDQSFSVELDGADLDLPTRMRDISWWRPMSASLWARSLFLLIPVALIVILEICSRVSKHSDGIVSPSANTFVNSLSVYVPALILLGVRTLFESLYFAARIFQPYHNLKKGGMPPSTTVMEDQNRGIVVMALWRALRKRQWAVMSAAVAVSLAPFLPVVVSGLYTVNNTLLSSNVTLTHLNRLNMSDGYFYTKATSSKSAWLGELILEYNSTYTQWTYQELSFPKVELALNDTRVSDYMGNASLSGSYVTARLPAVYTDMGCEELPVDNYQVAFVNPDGEPEGEISLNVTSLGDLDLSYCLFGEEGLVEYRLTDALSSSDYFNEWLWPYNYYEEPEIVNGDLVNVSSPIPADRLPSGCPVTVVMYGQVSSDASRVDEIVVLKCRPRVMQSDFDVLLSLPDYQFNLTTPPVKVQDSDTVLFDGYMDGSIEAVIPSDLDFTFGLFVPMKANDNSTQALDALFRSMVQGAKSNMGILTAQLINAFGREDYSTENASAIAARPSSSANLNWPFRARVVQDQNTTRVLQAILAAMTICGAVSTFMVDTRKVLPKNPLSIAAAASLFADSKMLQLAVGERKAFIPKGTEWYSNKELQRRGIFETRTYAMSWWDAAGERVNDYKDGKAGHRKSGKRTPGTSTDETTTALGDFEGVRARRKYFTIDVEPQ
ncbi:hypothetical protein LTR70_002099 [Exophiala xenobiotica]|nr:hypothetical protein LTR70_002099 [Exophiala xenobiotica]